MKLMKIQITPQSISLLFIKYKNPRMIKIIKGLPEDAKFLRAYYNPVHDIFELIFESEEFQDIPKGAAIPFFEPVFRSVAEVISDEL